MRSTELTSSEFTSARSSSEALSAEGHYEPPLRVAVLAACPFPANHGTPGSIRELCESTAERGHDVHVVTYHFGDDLPLRGVRLHRIPDLTGESSIIVGPTRNRPLYDLLLVFKAIQVVRKHRIDVIHAHGYEAALAAALCRFVTRRPIVYSAHNTMGDELASYDFFRYRWMADSLAWILDRTVPRIGNRCIPHSHNMVHFLRERGLKQHSEDVVHWGIDLASLPKDEGDHWRKVYELGEDPVILYSGVMDQFQRLDLLIDAMPHVVARQPRARLVFLVTVKCDRHIEWIRERANRRGVLQHVVLTGPQDLDGAMRRLAMADVTVVPRPQTPAFPIKLLNYMGMRRPCVMFASSASGVEHLRHVYLAPEDTPRSLATGLLELLENRPLRESMAEHAFQYVCAHHDRRLLAQRVVACYQRVLQPTRRWRDISRRPAKTVAPISKAVVSPGNALSTDRMAESLVQR